MYWSTPGLLPEFVQSCLSKQLILDVLSNRSLSDLFKILSVEEQTSLLRNALKTIPKAQLLDLIPTETIVDLVADQLKLDLSTPIPEPTCEKSKLSPSLTHSSEIPTAATASDTVKSSSTSKSFKKPALPKTTDIKNPLSPTIFATVDIDKLKVKVNSNEVDIAKQILNKAHYYPDICLVKNCNLCLSWILTQNLTPCSPHLNCSGNCTSHSVYPHNNRKATRLLRQYHAQKRSLHILFHESKRPDPTWMRCLASRNSVANALADIVSLNVRKRISHIIGISMDALTKYPIEQEVPLSDSDSEDGPVSAEGGSVEKTLKRGVPSISSGSSSRFAKRKTTDKLP